MVGTVVNIAKINVTEYRDIAISAIKNNILAIRDLLVLGGTVPGWDRTITGTEEPSRIMYKTTQSGSTEWVAITDITWTSGNMTHAKLKYSTNSTNGTDGTWNNLIDSGTPGLFSCTYTFSGEDLISTSWGSA